MVYTTAVPTFYDHPPSRPSHSRGRLSPVVTSSVVISSSPPTPSSPTTRAFSVNVEGMETDDEDEESRDDPPAIDDGRARIPKPLGEVGRPDRGGYSLRAVLAPTPTLYQDLIRLARQLVTKHLSPAICYSRQSKRNLAEALSDGASQLPVLNDYVDCWPLVDALRMRLKYTSSKAKAKTGTGSTLLKRQSSRLKGLAKNVRFEVTRTGSQ
ncbi:hypothetical protein PUNSTDRAFT_139645 [Punctularia strigosozonata HHB-11173 SS5]|uniref:Uncharacterized protein n=1 Tax=Punctularia strigosozonata (strain HHB-11173) TaxID=741275 RepID=R7RYY7_PUNST|nr:uncharacterized protein PUNSTDRAFT_139645 [Punctularia strigosozonata HHB-11173 SS5]EIN03340.1 hypothetical protein PUNSTDRAFT_139645 [Punctularia strigosozonata HHB-11173 SS5]